MRPNLMLAATLASTITAQTTTLKVFQAGVRTESLDALEGSVVNANADATTFAMQCKSDAPKASCQLQSAATITQGPSTFYMSGVYSLSAKNTQDIQTLIFDCVLTSSTKGGSCSTTVIDDIAISTKTLSTSTSSHFSFTSDQVHYQPLTVTAGVDKLNAPKATQADDVAAKNAGI
ncbi:hypothetical protein ASPWEDRAFT_41253 [Aspergillus wentii DTO 134E9]|uniref:Uncharacterized protein n=1 Tax=Aspergillus wentii DTO 134E9 TaxID=1073089 RepID=A0A1L9RM98_ASPWE|nr:uncharacterized protein ASPWEDRAFT_41253 [Aspergillus wentii DTO 134E9]KAI9929533.1 hypothetical protein MW887_001006 [Aspergillus wentii]OJJ36024.1 hypothetical protein ASPWEDRAFT_41253 [Aspergillus wentii DTO 134E9]